VIEAERERNGWRLGVREEKESKWVQLRARWAIDASGRNGFLARRLTKVRVHDRLLGVAAVYHQPNRSPGDSFGLIEATPLGLWYSAPLPSCRMIVVFMSDADLIRKHVLFSECSWLDHVATSVHTKRRIARASLRLPLHTRPAYSQVAELPVGDSWIATGDAAASFDPLTSMGIGYALLSGIESARVVHNALTGSGQLTQIFAQSVAEHFANYMQLRRSIYRMEQRWPEQPFWSRRHG